MYPFLLRNSVISRCNVFWELHLEKLLKTSQSTLWKDSLSKDNKGEKNQVLMLLVTKITTCKQSSLTASFWQGEREAATKSVWGFWGAFSDRVDGVEAANRWCRQFSFILSKRLTGINKNRPDHLFTCSFWTSNNMLYIKTFTVHQHKDTKTMLFLSDTALTALTKHLSLDIIR